MILTPSSKTIVTEMIVCHAVAIGDAAMTDMTDTTDMMTDTIDATTTGLGDNKPIIKWRAAFCSPHNLSLSIYLFIQVI